MATYEMNVKYTTMISKVSNLSYRSDFIISVILNELKLKGFVMTKVVSNSNIFKTPIQLVKHILWS